MTTLREAAQQALEFCEFLWREVSMNDYAEEQRERIETALKAALEQPEPVALPEGYEPHELPADYTGKLWIEGQVRRLYEASPPRREWRSLSEEEIDRWTPEIHPVIRAVEAALRSKNHD